MKSTSTRLTKSHLIFHFVFGSRTHFFRVSSGTCVSRLLEFKYWKYFRSFTSFVLRLLVGSLVAVFPFPEGEIIRIELYFLFLGERDGSR